LLWLTSLQIAQLLTDAAVQYSLFLKSPLRRRRRPHCIAAPRALRESALVTAMFEHSRVSFRMHILPGALSNVEGALRAQLNQSILTCAPRTR
jgi:hypothetical protein